MEYFNTLPSHPDFALHVSGWLGFWDFFHPKFTGVFIMADEFLSNFSIESNPPNDSPAIPTGDREKFKLIAVGSAEGIREMIHRIHVCGIAEAGAWSRLLPTPNSAELMSVLLIYRRRDRS
jgi:hypothetical protein